MNEEELSQLFEKLARDSSLTEEELKKLATATGKTTTSFDAMNKSAKDLMGSVTSLTKTIYQGKATVSSYADAMTAGTDAIGSFVSNFGPWGKAIGFGVELIGKYFGAAAKQADALQKGFQSLNKVGGVTSRGFSDIQESLRDFRLGIGDIDEFTKMIGDNTQSLSRMGSTIQGGYKAVGKLASGITGNDGLLLQFRNMGETVESINATAFNYASIQTRLGRDQIRVQDLNSKSLEEAIEKQNELTRLTGMSAKAQQDAQEVALQNEQFRATLVGLDKDEAQRRMDIFKNLQAIDPSKQLSAAFASLQTGFVKGSVGVGAYQASNGKAFKVATDATLDAASATEQFVKAFSDVNKKNTWQQVLGSLGDFSQMTSLSYYALADAQDRVKLFSERMAEAKTETGNMKTAQEAALQSLNKLDNANLKSRDNMQEFVSKGIGPATTALADLAEVARNLTNLLPKFKGGVKGAVAGAASGGMAGAALGSFTGPGAVVSAIGGAVLGGVTGFAYGPGEQAPGFKQSVSNSAILDMIAKAESTGGSYESAYPNTTVPGLTDMTVGQVMLMQKDRASRYGSSAIGRYQFMPQTLKNMEKQGILDFNDKFSPENQDKWALALADQVGLSAFKSGKMTADQFADRLGGIWAGLPLSSGQSAHAGTLNNKATISRSEVLTALGSPGAALGGVLSGPKSGFSTTLHGIEAVVPLPDGRTIPVSMTGFTNTMDEQTEVLMAQLGKFDELISAMRDQVSISQKILQVSYN